MNRQHLLVLFSILNAWNCVASVLVDEEKIKQVCNLYITSITDYSKNIDVNNSYENLLFRVFDYNTDTYIHQNDLFDDSYANENDIDSYLGYIDVIYDNKIDTEFGETEVLNCTTTQNGRKYVFATVLKTLSYKNKVREVEIIFGLYNNNNSYIVEYVLFSNQLNNKNLITECSIDAIEEDKLKMEREYLNAANDAFSRKDYLNANRLYEMVLSFNSNNAYALDGLQNCRQLLTKERVKTEIDILVRSKNYRSALDGLSIFKQDYPSYDIKWVVKTSTECENGLAFQAYENNLRIADSKYESALYKDAVLFYENAKNYNEANLDYINVQIERCRIGSPEQAKKLIKKAYDQAKVLKSKWLNTYMTYIKYQNSGLLNGEHYYFMCSMMETKYSEIAKKMGYSRNQANKLAVKYLLKAEEFGFNTDFMRTQVINSRRIKKTKNEKN